MFYGDFYALKLKYVCLKCPCVFLSYLKTLTKIKLYSDNILTLHAFNLYILIIKCFSIDVQNLEKICFGRVNVPDAKNLNVGSVNVILIGF